MSIEHYPSLQARSLFLVFLLAATITFGGGIVFHEQIIVSSTLVGCD
jgi:hypothetical protein